MEAQKQADSLGGRFRDCAGNTTFDASVWEVESILEAETSRVMVVMGDDVKLLSRGSA